MPTDSVTETLLFRKHVHLYECMDSRQKFKETSLPDKEGVH